MSTTNKRPPATLPATTTSSSELAEAAMDDENPPNPQRRYWRSSSWSASHSAPPSPRNAVPGMDMFPLTPRNQQQQQQQQQQQGSGRTRPNLPPLQPVGRIDDNNREWAPLTPRRDINRMRNGLEIKLDLAAVQRCRDSSEPSEMQMKRDKFAYYDKECSRVAEHIYLGSDAVARNRETLLANKITHVLNCVGFICKEYFPENFKYNTLWLQDSPSEDITSILYDVFDYFEEVREQNGRVFVHCCQGVSRSTALVIAYLMWRDGRSFEDAFQDVKAARGITNPNMGFACQLLQAQKRVHAAPVSPNSLLRMYRMAPHSPYDALHLVPKTVNNPSPKALDSRGSFVVQVPTAIFVWAGKYCEQGMEALAKAAASQVVRYERAQAPIICIQEGEEPTEFWEAFNKGSNQSSSGAAVPPRQHCDKRVADYDLDFEVYQRALQGVVPPSGVVPTHVPARDSGWSRLRKKVLSGSMRDKKVAGSSPSSSSEQGDQSGRDSSSSDSSSSPRLSSCPSPSCSLSRSQTPSPTSPYSWSPASSSDDSSAYLSPCSASPVLRLSSAQSGKGGASLAERRGLRATSLDELPPTPRFGKSFSNLSFEQAEAGETHGETEVGSDAQTSKADSSAPAAGELMEMVRGHESHRRRAEKLEVYKWPSKQKLDGFERGDLESCSVFIIMLGTQHVFVWYGTKVDSSATHDWKQIGINFLECMDRPCGDLSIKIVEEGHEPDDFWEIFV